MKSPLYRLQRMKFALLGMLLTVAGITVLALAERQDSIGAFMRTLYGAEVGASMLTAGLIGVFVDYRSRRDADEHRDEGLRRIFQEVAPALRDSVIDGFAAKQESLSKVVSAATLDQVVRNCLTSRLGDHELATDVYDDLQAQVISARNRCYDAKASIVLTPWSKSPASGPDAMFVATVRWEYQVSPLAPSLRFSCVATDAEYRALLRDPASTTTWLFKPGTGIKASSEEAFEVIQVSLDGKEQRIRRAVRAESQTFMVALDERTSTNRKRPTLSYTFRTLVRREGRLLNLDIAQPTKGLHIQLLYGGCGIQTVKVLDYIASAQQPQITQLPGSASSPSVSIGFDGWVWPKGGVGFAWNLDVDGHS